jgi:hypothetical protein
MKGVVARAGDAVLRRTGGSPIEAEETRSHAAIDGTDRPDPPRPAVGATFRYAEGVLRCARCGDECETVTLVQPPFMCQAVFTGLCNRCVSEHE